MGRVTDVQIALAAIQNGLAKSSDDVARAVAIALAESGGNTDATNTNTNGSVDRGVWQINSVHGFPPAQLFTLDGNAKAAASVRAKQGWQAWSAFKNGSYFPFMVRGRIAAGIALKDPTAAGGGRAETDLDLPDIPNPLAGLQTALAFLTDVHNWQRLGMFILGGLLVIVGLLKLTGDNRLSEGTKTLAKAAVLRKAG